MNLLNRVCTVFGVRRPANFDDQMLCGRLQSAAARLADARPRLGFADAVTEIAQMARGRADLLAQAAGLTLCGSQLMADWPMRTDRARLLIAAGADRSAIAHWVQIGRDRTKGSAGGAREGEPLPDLDAVFTSVAAVELPPGLDDRF
jgi:hypothetical protein